MIGILVGWCGMLDLSDGAALLVEWSGIDREYETSVACCVGYGTTIIDWRWRWAEEIIERQVVLFFWKSVGEQVAMWSC